VDTTAHGHPYGRWVKARRSLLGMTQRDLARQSGVPQPHVSAIETGRRTAGAAVRARLDDALAMYPSYALELSRDTVVDAFVRRGHQPPRVFGSIARGSDSKTSDIDLLARLQHPFGYLDLAELVDELESILTFPVDVADDAPEVTSSALAEARHEAVPL
jgi:predicted nucleotidyltransferase